MKINVVSAKPVQVITKTEAPWTMEGRTGVTYRVGILYDNDVEKMKVVSKEVYDGVTTGVSYFVEFQIEVSNGSVREPKIAGFRPVNK
jgi:hypothetical protein